MFQKTDILKPKANKLLEFISHHQSAEPAKTVELSRFFEELSMGEAFPTPIALFLNLPLFKELMEVFAEGRAFQEDLSPRFQTFGEAFHKLVHLDYSTEIVEDPLVGAKLYAQNIHEYFLAAEIFFPYGGKSVEEILNYLFSAIRRFAEHFKHLILTHEDLFSTELMQHTSQPFFLHLCTLERSNFKPSLMEDWHPISIELNLDPKLSLQSKQLSSLVKAHAHKLLNQLQTIMAKKRQFYQRNTPTYTPHEIEEKIFPTIDAPLSGQKVNERFCALFSEERYVLIEGKETSINKKLFSYLHAIWPVKESLFSLVNTYNSFLPEPFSDYLLNVLGPLALDNTIFGKPNHLAVQLTLGIYTVQYDYLIELLNPCPVKELPPALSKQIYNLIPVLLSFMESYYSFKPTPSFKTIKNQLEHFYSGEDGIKIHPPDEIKGKISQALSLLIPSKTAPLDLLIANLQKIVKDLTQFASDLPSDSLECTLLKERVRYLSNLDLPSVPQSWFSIGEILGIFIIVLSRTEDLFHEKLDTLKGHLTCHPFIKTLFS